MAHWKNCAHCLGDGNFECAECLGTGLDFWDEDDLHSGLDNRDGCEYCLGSGEQDCDECYGEGGEWCE